MAAKKTPSSDDEQSGRMFRTSIVVSLEQIEALKDEAAKLQRERVRKGHAAGKADVSEILRGVLDQWMKSREK